MTDTNQNIEIIATIQNKEIPINTTTLGTVYLTQIFGLLNTPFKFRQVGQDNWLNGLAIYPTLNKIDNQLKDK